jgi:hypothetical protein
VITEIQKLEIKSIEDEIRTVVLNDGDAVIPSLESQVCGFLKYLMPN